MTDDVPRRSRLEAILEEANSRPARWLAMIFLLAAVHFTVYWSPSPDACSYLSIARSLAQNGRALDQGRPSHHYPLGYPLLLAPLFCVADDPFFLISLVNVLAAGAIVWGVYRWTRELAPKAALMITGLTVVNPSFWDQMAHFNSEIVFMALLVWSALAINKLLRKPDEGCASFYGWALLATVLAAMCTLVRQAGLAISIGYALASFREAWRGNVAWRRALSTSLLAVLPSLALLVAFMLHNKSVAEQESSQAVAYTDLLRKSGVSLADQMLESVRLRITEIGRLLLPFMFKAYAKPYSWLNINTAVYLTTTVIVLIGYVRLLYSQRSDSWLFAIPMYAGVYLIWPFDQDTRFFMPILPVLWLCVWTWLERFESRRLSILFVLGVIHLAAWTFYTIEDRVVVARLQPYWQPIHRIAREIPGDQRDKVVMVNVESHVQQMVRYVFNWYVPSIENDGAIPVDTRWIIKPSANGGLELREKRASGLTSLSFPSSAWERTVFEAPLRDFVQRLELNATII